MSESAANEFTPLLLTEEEQTTQSTTTTPTTSKTQNYQTQESSTSTQDHAVTYASESTQQQSSNTQGGQRGNNGGLFGRRTNDTAVSSTLGDGKYDKHEIVRHRSRLASYPVLPEPEEIKKGYEAAAHALGIDRLLQAAADSMGGEDGVDGSHGGAKPDSKYMVVGTVRFWFVFITIMLCMVFPGYIPPGKWLRSLRLTLLCSILRGLFRHHPNGIDSSRHYLVFQRIQRSLLVDHRLYDYKHRFPTALGETFGHNWKEVGVYDCAHHIRADQSVVRSGQLDWIIHCGPRDLWNWSWRIYEHGTCHHE